MGAKKVTKADRLSIMNYNKLFADFDAGKVTNLSVLDKTGAKIIYGAPRSDVHFLF